MRDPGCTQKLCRDGCANQLRIRNSAWLHFKCIRATEKIDALTAGLVMTQCLWNWSPHFDFPLSGKVAQDFNQDIRQFFDAIPNSAGVGSIEYKIFNENSYGDQLSTIINAILYTIHSKDGKYAHLEKSIKDLEDLFIKKEKIKSESSKELECIAIHAMEKLKRMSPTGYESALRKITSANTE